MMLEDILHDIAPADARTAQAARARWASIAKPVGSLGLLEDDVTRMCAMTRDVGYSPRKRCVVVFCADNGVVAQKVTEYGSEVTHIMSADFCSGSTSVCKMAEVAHADVIPVDMGIETPVDDPRMRDFRIAAGTHDMSLGPAMSRAEARSAIERSIGLADELAGEGYDLIATGEMGIGNTTTSSAVASVLLGRPVATMTGPGAGLSDGGLKHKIEVIERAIDLNHPDREDPLDVLAKVGGFDIAGMAGMFIGCARNHRPCAIDGFISAVSALVACRICPPVRDYLVASHLSTEPADRLVLEDLGVSPIITARMRLGEGTGAVAVMPVLDMAFNVFHTMQTFDDIGVAAHDVMPTGKDADADVPHGAGSEGR